MKKKKKLFQILGKNSIIPRNVNSRPVSSRENFSNKEEIEFEDIDNSMLSLLNRNFIDFNEIGTKMYETKLNQKTNRDHLHKQRKFSLQVNYESSSIYNEMENYQDNIDCRFILQKPIGKGKFGTFFSAYHNVLKKKFALKIMERFE